MITEEYLKLTNYYGYGPGCTFSSEQSKRIQKNRLKTYHVVKLDEEDECVLEYYAINLEVLIKMLDIDFTSGTEFNIYEIKTEYITQYNVR